MAIGKITKRTVDSLVSGTTTAFLWDTDLKGFGARITPAGVISYVYQYRMGGREASNQRTTIGKHGSPWTPTTARIEAERLALLVGHGIDPVEENKERRREAVDLAFSNFADRFTASCKGAGWRRVVEQSLRIHIKPVLKQKSLPKISRIDVVSVIDAMPEEQVGNRRNVFAVLRRLFRWAVSRGDLKISPMEGMETPPAVRPRDRWLLDEELRRIWTAAPQTHPCFGPIVRLLIVTGQRREEVSSMDWNELDRSAKIWTLPSDRTKNSEPNTVPLNALAISELDQRAKGTTWPKRGRVFATSTGAGFTAYAKGKLKLDRLIGEAGDPLKPWRLHDLRRTFATGMQRLGVRFEVTEALLNHVSGSRAGVAGIYQRHDWKPEKVAALDAWNAHLSMIFDQASEVVAG